MFKGFMFRSLFSYANILIFCDICKYNGSLFYTKYTQPSTSNALHPMHGRTYLLCAFMHRHKGARGNVRPPTIGRGTRSAWVYINNSNPYAP